MMKKGDLKKRKKLTGAHTFSKLLKFQGQSLRGSDLFCPLLPRLCHKGKVDNLAKKNGVGSIKRETNS